MKRTTVQTAEKFGENNRNDYSHTFRLQYPDKYFKVKRIQRDAKAQEIYVDDDPEKIFVTMVAMPNANFTTNYEIDYGPGTAETLETIVNNISKEQHSCYHSLCMQLRNDVLENESFEPIRDLIDIHCGERRASIRPLNEQGVALFEQIYKEKQLYPDEDGQDKAFYEFIPSDYARMVDDLLKMMDTVARSQDEEVQSQDEDDEFDLAYNEHEDKPQLSNEQNDTGSYGGNPQTQKEDQEPPQKDQGKNAQKRIPVNSEGFASIGITGIPICGLSDVFSLLSDHGRSDFATGFDEIIGLWAEIPARQQVITIETIIQKAKIPYTVGANGILFCRKKIENQAAPINKGTQPSKNQTPPPEL